MTPAQQQAAAAPEIKREEGSQTQATAVPENAKVIRVPGVQLDASPGKEVILRVPGSSQSYRGRIVGFDPYEFVIIKVRLPSALRRELANGRNVVVKYVHQGTVNGFMAQVENAITTPAPLLFIQYPNMVEKLALRSSKRKECNIDGVLHTTDDEVECLIVNASESGCKLSVRVGERDVLRQTRVDDALIVAMNLGSLGELKVAVAVKNLSREKGIMTMGCMFLDISKEEMGTIREYLDKISRHSL
ncbi:flagellar brake protein [Pseudodesulfovibrio cashew]|uniref:Flagellar brake protein n=1 Tax=Pseudodesulfovibrio cashew TaxID=2678688 RepID=A0A6I6JFW0_9BACT|nr:flagellar brake protein [Pseudodesulfovibrio cashew]QGY40059.1 flagellar brake protein [Pseudodesulfovibrio cashew]